jgi:uncharacterized membrane protein YciS (DUF1049 family)
MNQQTFQNISPVAPAELPDHLRHSGQRLQNQQIAPRPKVETMGKSLTLFPSDRNGCGFYRTIIPFNYLVSKYDYDCSTLFSFNFDLNFIARSKYIRFQRQVTDAQKKVIAEYKKVIKQVGSESKLVYECDDSVHLITPDNIIAYQFYTQKRKENYIDILRMCDIVTFSTQFLKDFHKEKFGIESVVIPNYLPKFLWQDKGKRDKRNKGKKPRILVSGSSSHAGKGGDWSAVEPLIEKTKKEFEWVFLGVIPPHMKGHYEFHEWADFYSYPGALDAIDADLAVVPIADKEFNLAKSDLKLLEYTACGLPSVFSSIGEGMGPYDLIPGVCAVKNNTDDWYNAIKKVASDNVYRDSVLNAQKQELSKRWLEDPANIEKYLQTYA